MAVEPGGDHEPPRRARRDPFERSRRDPSLLRRSCSGGPTPPRAPFLDTPLSTRVSRARCTPRSARCRETADLVTFFVEGVEDIAQAIAHKHPPRGARRAGPGQRARCVVRADRRSLGPCRGFGPAALISAVDRACKGRHRVCPAAPIRVLISRRRSASYRRLSALAKSRHPAQLRVRRRPGCFSLEPRPQKSVSRVARQAVSAATTRSNSASSSVASS